LIHHLICQYTCADGETKSARLGEGDPSADQSKAKAGLEAVEDRPRLAAGADRYYVIDIRRNCVTQQYVDVEDLARELKVLLRRQMRSPDLSRPPLAPNQSWEELRAESGVAGAGKRQGSQRKVATRTRLRQNPNDVSDSIGYILKRARHSQVFLDVLFLTSN